MTFVQFVRNSADVVLMGGINLKRVVERETERSWLMSLAPLGAVVTVISLRLSETAFRSNADTTYPIRLSNDILHGNTKGWVVPPTPYFFPDVAISLPFTAIGGAGVAYLVYAFVIGVATYFAVRWIVSLLTPNAPLSVRRWAPAVTLCLIAAPRIPRFRFSVDLYDSILGSAVHGGAALITLLLIALTYEVLVERKVFWSRCLWMSALALLGSASDRLVIAHSFFPVLYLSLIGLRNQHSTRSLALRRCASWIVLFVAAATVGVWSNALLIRLGLRRWTGVGPQLGVGGLIRLSLSGSFWFFEHPAWTCAVIVCVAKLLQKRKRGANLSVMTTALIVLAGSTLLTTGAFGYAEPVDARRLLPFFLVPLIIAPVPIVNWLDSLFSRRPLGYRRSLQLAPVATMFCSLAVALLFSHQLPYRPTVSCVDQYRSQGIIHAGLVSYWNAGDIEIKSKTEGTVFSLDVHSNIWFGLRNMRSLAAMDQDARIGGEPIDFVIPEHIVRSEVERSFGQPDRKLTCGRKTEIWVYEPIRLRSHVKKFQQQTNLYLATGELPKS